MTKNILSRDIQDLHSYLRWHSISKYIDCNLETLDVGCNIGTMTLEIAKQTSNVVVGVDIDPNCVRQAEERANRHKIANCKFLFGDGTSLPFSDGSFEQVLLADVLEHVVEDHKVIEECYRVLKPG
ncbi:MAG: class I SAM-dependent methyltransferase, partial [Ignavibacteriales bacterium]|nr:class I SAM-dependent methyltransferase [Ignavibacteriales bacterium]